MRRRNGNHKLFNLLDDIEKTDRILENLRAYLLFLSTLYYNRRKERQFSKEILL